MKQHIHKPLAFTMIEILFVIVVICIIMLAGVKFLNSQTDETKAELTAKQMRLWLQAGLTYHNATQTWPGSATTLMQAYPETIKPNNAWGGAFTAQAVGKDDTSFAVSTIMPNAKLASRVRSLLGQTDNQTGNQVTVTVGSSVKPKLNRSFIIKDIKNVNAMTNWHRYAGDIPQNRDPDSPWGGDSYRLRDHDRIDHNILQGNAKKILIPVPQCPVGMKPGYQISLSGFAKGCHQSKARIGGDEWSCTTGVGWLPEITHTGFTRSVVPYQSNKQPVRQANGQLAWEYWVKTTGQSDDGPGVIFHKLRDLPNYHGGLTYMTYCQGEAYS